MMNGPDITIARRKSRRLRSVAVAVILVCVVGLASARAPVPAATAAAAVAADTLEAPDEPVEKDELEAVRVLGEGRASYYGFELAGHPTANGERFDPEKLTAAHPSLPFGTRIRVTNLRNGKSVVVRINDRGPFVGRRILDLSYAAAREIGMIRRGVANVRIDVLQRSN